MGYSGNYTGYSVTGLDVFLWILLTAGSIGFPMLVLTICCIKRHCKDQDQAHHLLYGEPMLKKKRGVLGPYIGDSQENLEKKATPKRTLPEITSPTLLADPSQQPNADKSVHVRFKDDSNDLYAHDSPNLIRDDGANDYTNIDGNPADLRGLKDAVNLFTKRPLSKSFKSPTTVTNNTTTKIISEIENILPTVNMSSNRYVSERVVGRPSEASYRVNKPNESSYRITKPNESSYRAQKPSEASYRIGRANESSYRVNASQNHASEDPQSSVYAISSSYRLPMASKGQQKQQPVLAPQVERTVSIENIYSQVVVSTNRNLVSDIASNDHSIGEDSKQPVYMNTSLFRLDLQQQEAVSSQPSSRQASNRQDNASNWDDSTV